MKALKKYFLIFILVISGLLICCSEEEKQNEVSQTVFVGEVIQIDIDDDCEFVSNDTTIATVTQDGIVKGISEGTTKIIATSASKTYELSLTVTDDSEAISLTCECKQTLAIDEEVNLNPEVSNSTDSYVYTYSSNDTSVATVSSSGVIKGISSGICTITVKAVGSTTITKEIFIYVKGENTSGEVITNLIENKTYNITGNLDLTALNSNITNIVEKYKGSIVGVSNYQYVQSYMQRELVEASVGTGFIFDSLLENGTYTYYVLTNYHVIESNVKLKIYFGYDDVYVDATLLGSNSSLDLAVVAFTSTDVLEILELGDVSTVSDGDFAIAIGNSNGYEYFGSVTFGVISYCNRELTGEEAVFLQHDVAINPGNSGGPLLDINGKVIGINTLKIVDDDVDNMGFAISIETVKDYLETLGWDF